MRGGSRQHDNLLEFGWYLAIRDFQPTCLRRRLCSSSPDSAKRAQGVLPAARLLGGLRLLSHAQLAKTILDQIRWPNAHLLARDCALQLQRRGEVAAVRQCEHLLGVHEIHRTLQFDFLPEGSATGCAPTGPDNSSSHPDVVGRLPRRKTCQRMSCSMPGFANASPESRARAQAPRTPPSVPRRCLLSHVSDRPGPSESLPLFLQSVASCSKPGRPFFCPMPKVLAILVHHSRDSFGLQFILFLVGVPVFHGQAHGRHQHIHVPEPSVGHHHWHQFQGVPTSFPGCLHIRRVHRGGRLRRICVLVPKRRGCQIDEVGHLTLRVQSEYVPLGPHSPELVSACDARDPPRHRDLRELVARDITQALPDIFLVVVGPCSMSLSCVMCASKPWYMGQSSTPAGIPSLCTCGAPTTWHRSEEHGRASSLCASPCGGCRHRTPGGPSCTSHREAGVVHHRLVL